MGIETKEDAIASVRFLKRRIENLREKLATESYNAKHEEDKENLDNLIATYEEFLTKYGELLI